MTDVELVNDYIWFYWIQKSLKKIIDIAKNELKISYIDHPHKKLKIKNMTNKLDDLLNLDCIFITSPNHTHFRYLNYLKKKKYKGYIFYEKPPVLKLIEIKKLKKFNLKTTYFNYNYRHSGILKFFKDNKRLGKITMINIIDSKPLIYKKNIKHNWRFQLKEILVNNNLIHFIDLVSFNFKKDISNLKLQNSRSQKNLKIFDTISASFKIGNIISNISLSYGTVVEKKILIYYSNGKVEITNDKIYIYYPGNLKNIKLKIYQIYH